MRLVETSMFTVVLNSGPFVQRGFFLLGGVVKQQKISSREV